MQMSRQNPLNFPLAVDLPPDTGTADVMGAGNKHSFWRIVVDTGD